MSSYEYLAFYKIGGATTLRLSVIQPHQMLATGIFVQTLTGRILTVKNVVLGDTIEFFKIRVQEMEGEAFTHPCLQKGFRVSTCPTYPTPASICPSLCYTLAFGQPSPHT